MLLRTGGGLLGAAFGSQLEFVEQALASEAMDASLPSTPSNVGFNAFHAPTGAYATFILGRPGASGGLAMELKAPANQDVFVGVGDTSGFRALPFFTPQSGDPSVIELATVQRDYRVATDDWSAEDLDVRILSPAGAVPEPGRASVEEMRDGLLPAVLMSVTVDNRAGRTPRRGLFGLRLPSSSTPSSSSPTITAASTGTPRFLYDDGSGRTVGVYCADAGATAAAGSDVQAASTGAAGGEGSVGMLRLDVPAGRQVTFRVAIAFWHAGSVVTDQVPDGFAASFWYTTLFNSVDAVAAYALANYDRLAALWQAQNGLFDHAELSRDQRFQLVHAVRSYFGNTALLSVAGAPMWVVLEGEYANLNTFDLTVDHVFFELRNNPWTVRNELDWFLQRWSYTDHTNAIVTETNTPTVIVYQPGATVHSPTPEPGGISVTHDMGSWPTFAAAGTSNYEKPGMAAVSSFMTAEELTNWTLSALAYIAQTADQQWTKAHLQTLEDCLTSLVNRDDYRPAKRDGVMSMETDREGPNGREITTYDALDPSLGQARHSAYLTGKQWAAYVCLAKLFDTYGRAEQASIARLQARRAAESIVAAAKASGFIPALLPADGEPASTSRVIPAVEGLLFPLYAGAPEALSRTGDYSALLATMKHHLASILTTGQCLFSDGGWKLSSTSDNSWLSKVYLGQHIYRRILGLPWDVAQEKADATHVSWLTGSTPSPAGFGSYGADYWAWSDQFISGEVSGSRYYPRGVTGILWLEEHPATASLSPKPAAVGRRPSAWRTVTLRLRPPRHQRIVWVRVFVNGRHVETQHGSSIKYIRLKLPRGRSSVVRVTARTNRGRRLHLMRRFH